MIPHVHVANQGAQRTCFSYILRATTRRACWPCASCMVRCLPRARAWPAVWLSLAVSTGPRRGGASGRHMHAYSGGAVGCLDVELFGDAARPRRPGSGAARRDGGRGRLCATGVRGASRREFRAIANDQERAA